MSPEIILLAIGCYLFCGVEEKVYKIKTGDWWESGIKTNFENELNAISFIPQKTTYNDVIQIFKNGYSKQRTHRLLRRQEYDGKAYYFNREVRYVYRQSYMLPTRMFNMYYSSNLEVYLFFKDNILQFYDIIDERVDEKTGRRYFGSFHNSLFNKKEGDIVDCNKLFYDIFTLYNIDKWGFHSSHCDFYKDPTYWDDRIYEGKKYFHWKGSLPCGGTIFNSC